MDPDLRRKPGRPRNVDEPTVLSTSVTKHDYDLLCKMTKRGESLSATVRKVIERGLREPKL